MPSVKDKSTLNPKRLAFCREYVKDSNGTQAAIRAGYSESTAQEQSSQLLSILMVNQEINRLTTELMQEAGWSVGRSQLELLATRQRAITLNQPSAEVSALVAVNRMYDLDQAGDKGINAPPALSELETGVLAQMRADAKALTKPHLSKEIA